jgi:hypothetical protein
MGACGQGDADQDGERRDCGKEKPTAPPQGRSGSHGLMLLLILTMHKTNRVP